MQPCVLLRFGEIVLRGRNRWRFYSQLHENVHRATRGLGTVRFHQRGGVLALVSEERHDELLERVRDVLGAASVHPALIVEKTPEAAAQVAIELLRGRSGSFAVRARRRVKTFPLGSQELAIHVGSRVQEELGLPVDLSHPDTEVHVEVDRDEVYAFTEKLPGRGGLPVGSSGRALVLLSGGIDSPVAAYRMMKRGLRCDFVHFSGRPFTGPESVY
jgi:thiamine biosynthesis protein ThiI